MKLTWFLARRYLGAHRGGGRLLSFITWIALGGIIVGVSALVVVIGVMAGMQAELRSNILEGNPHIFVYERSGAILVRDWQEVLSSIEGVDGVVAASPLVWGYALMENAARFGQPVRVLGVPAEPTDRPVTEVEGRLRGGDLDLGHPGAGSRPLVVGLDLANRMPVFTGDSVVVITSPAHEGVQLDRFGELRTQIRGFEVTGTISTGAYDHDSQYVYTTLDAAQELLGLDDEDIVSMIAVRTADPENVDRITNRLEDALGPTYFVEPWTLRNGPLLGALKLEKLAMGLILFLIVIVAAFNIVSTLVMVVADRTREIGILKSMGMTKTGILRVFMLQGAWIGVVGTLLGATLGIVACWALDTFQIIKIPPEVYLVDRLPVLLDPLDVLLIVTASVALSFVAPIYPSIQASRLEPVDAIRHE